LLKKKKGSIIPPPEICAKRFTCASGRNVRNFLQDNCRGEIAGKVDTGTRQTSWNTQAGKNYNYGPVTG
jgi:hypothetical protein